MSWCVPARTSSRCTRRNGRAAAEFYDQAAAGYRVVRHPTSLMVPEPTVAARMQRLIAENDIETVWFGAAAPLALLGPLARRAGARRVVASTHGHEVGWSMLPVARSALRRIGDDADVVTFISRYTRGRFASAFGPLRGAGASAAGRRHRPVSCPMRWPGPSCVLATGWGSARWWCACPRLVPRKGQDMLIRAWPAIRRRVPDAALVIVGGGPYLQSLQQLAHTHDVAADVTFTGAVPAAELPAHHAMADVFAMPCRTRGAGLDVEGLGIVYLEASACGVPVIAGTSGGAPETVLDGHTGTVVDGTDVAAVATAVGDVLADPGRAAAMGVAGRHWAVENWQWRSQGARLTGLLSG